MVLEQDGTPITKDEVLLLLHNETIMLLQGGEKWKPFCEEDKHSATTSTASTLSLMLSDIQSDDDSNQNQPAHVVFNTTNEAAVGQPATISVSQFENMPTILVDNNMEFMWHTFEIPWHKIPRDSVGACEKGLRKKEVVTQVVLMVANEMRSIKTNPSSKAVRLVAQKLISKFPKTFQDIDDDGVVLGDGSIGIFMKLYERLSYLNRPHKRPLQEQIFSKKLMRHTVAGCSHWNPELPNINHEDASVSKQKLNECINMDHLSDEMEQILEKTYPIQREFINNVVKFPTVAEILQEWPILFNKYALMWHFKKLCKIDLNTFISNLDAKMDMILTFNKENTVEEILDKYVKVLHVLGKYFKEDITSMYKLAKVIIIFWQTKITTPNRLQFVIM